MGEKGLRDPFLIRSPEGDKFFLIATDLSIGRQRRLGPLAAHRQQVHRGLGVHRPGELVGSSGTSRSRRRHRRQHLGAGGVLGRGAPAVRRVLGLEAVRRERPEPHRQHLQPDALRHHARLRHLQRAEDLAGPRRVADRLHGHQGRTAVLPLHQGRGRRRHRLLATSSRRSPLADRRRPAGQPVLDASWPPASAATPAPRRSRARPSSRPTPGTSPARPTTCSSTSTAAAATSRSAPTTWRRRTGGGRRATTCPPARATARCCRSPQAELDALRADRPRAADAGRGRRERPGRALRARRDHRHRGHRQRPATATTARSAATPPGPTGRSTSAAPTAT